MNRRGVTVWDILIGDVFSIVVGIGVVLVAVLYSTTSLSDSQLYGAKFHSENIALLVEAAQVVPRELNFFVQYHLPGFKAEVDAPDVIVDGGARKSFPFVVNPDFRVSDFSYEESQNNYGFFSLNRVGRRLFFSEGGRGELKDAVFCPEKRLYERIGFVPSDASQRLVLSGFGTFGSPPYTDADVVVGFMSVPDGVRVFVTEDTVSAGCNIVKQYVELAPYSSVNVVPVNAELLTSDDPRNLLKYSKGVVIGYDDDTDLNLLEQAVIGGLR